VSLLNRLGLNRHVTDADLVGVWSDNRVGHAPRNAAETHVQQCAACRTRLTALSTWLDGLRHDARQDADDAFPRERLATQQAQILRRLEAMERPAKVLTFPRFARAVGAHHSGRQRWIAAAAAAGLLVGIGLGQTFDFSRRSSLRATRPTEISRNTAPMMGVQRINVTSDEDFLYNEPVASRVPESLRSLHELTPSAREDDPR
jgi:hypothetical protein